MYRGNILVILTLCLLFTLCAKADEILSNNEIADKNDGYDDSHEVNVKKAVMDAYFLYSGLNADGPSQEILAAAGPPQEKYNKIKLSMNHILDIIKNRTNVFQFIEGNGIEQVIQVYLHSHYPDIRMQALEVFQRTFDVAPHITKKITPIEVLDTLLNLYGNKDVALKTEIMAILNLWLPENPRAQARLIKLKDLGYFYEQLDRVSAELVLTQLKLFGKIVKEHIEVIRKSDAKLEIDPKKQEIDPKKQKIDPKKFNIYQNIGLVERLSSNYVCHGLFNILQAVWELEGHNKEFMTPVFEILSDVQPYCTKTLYGRIEAFNLLKTLLNHVEEMDEESKKEYYDLGVNVTSVKENLQGYVRQIEMGYNVSKDEL